MIGVAVSGKIASGKTTAADALIRDLGFIRVGLADELKRMASFVVDWIDENAVLGCDFVPHSIKGLKDKTTEQGRMWLQFFGTDLIRQVDPDFWVRAFLRRASEMDRVVVDDVRFTNEAYALREVGFKVVRIRIPEEAQAMRLRTLYPAYNPALLLHASETELDSWPYWDAHFDGVASKEDFQRAVVMWARREFGL